MLTTTTTQGGEPMRTMTRTIGGLLPVTILVAVLVMLGTASRAQALTCTDVGGVEDTAGNCTLSVLFASAVDFTLTIPGDLVIAPEGGLLCNDPSVPPGASACNITVSVGGDMEMQAGSEILAENRTGGGS